MPNSPTKPVAVYTMGKVGSSSVTTALSGAGFEALQVHVLQGGAAGVKRRIERRPKARHLQTSLRLLDYIEAGEAPPTISLFREPVARNVSAFFQNFERLVGGDVEKLTVADTQKLICENVGPEETQHWVDKELADVASVELGRHELFRGPAVANEAAWPMLLMRSDLDDDLKSQSMRSFLKDDTIAVKRSSNVTAEKAGGELYGQIKKIGLPGTYVDACLSQAFVSSVLSPDEIEMTRSRWTESA